MSFQAVDRFIAEIRSGKPRPGYVLIGDEGFQLGRCRQVLVAEFVSPELRDFCLHDLDLTEMPIFDALDRARTPSLMAPFQLFFLRGLKALYGRGAKKEEFAAIDAYFRSPNPQALLVFVADHLHIPADARRMEMDDKTRYERIRETLGEWCGTVELAQASEEDVLRWLGTQAREAGKQLGPDAARELADALAADMLAVANAWEQLLLYTRDRAEITLADVELLVPGAKQRSLYELTDAISRRERPRALALLDGLLNSSDAGEDAAIGHLYGLAKTFRQMLVVLEKNVRDSRGIWSALWPGFRLPAWAADDLVRQARRYRSREDLLSGLQAITRADLALRSNPADKKLVLERLVLDLTPER